jgi:putative peptidoglycan lipid II flippase
MFRRKFGSIGHVALSLVLMKFVVAGLLSGGVGYWILQLMGGTAPGSFPLQSVISSVITCLSIGGVVAVVYILILKLLRVQEVNILLAPVVRLLRR